VPWAASQAKFGYKMRATMPVWKLEQPVLLHRVSVCIRECGSVPYLGMAMEMLNLPYVCITKIMAKKATNTKPSMHRE